MKRELYTDILEDDDDEAGVHRQAFASAVACWSFMQNRQTSVAEAAAAFNTSPEIVRQAIDDHHWTFPEWPEGETDPAKQYIGHEGE